MSPWTAGKRERRSCKRRSLCLGFRHVPPREKSLVSLCGQSSAVKMAPEERRAVSLHCRSWYCDECAPGRRNNVMRIAASGEPTRFLTLTSNPRAAGSPAERFALLRRSLHTAMQRLRRIPKHSGLEYFVVVEATKAGEPHLHVLLRSNYIPHAWLSAVMDELAQAPVVDIRKVRSPQEVVRYLAKYLTKAPARFGASKRYWSTRGYDLDPQPKKDAEPDGSNRWERVLEPLGSIVYRWTVEGWASRKHEQGGLVFWPGDPLRGLSP